MKLSRSSTCALQGLVHLAEHADGKPRTSQVMAEARGLPEAYLRRMLRQSVKAGILVPAKGPNGGYRLARPPAEISLLEIIEAVDGPLRGNVSVSSKGSTAELDEKLQALAHRATEQLRQQLQAVSLADLAGADGKSKRK